MERSFYDATTPADALDVYFEGDADLYGRMKNRAIATIVEDAYAQTSLRGRNVLEIGAGGGVWTGWFLERGAAVTCVDIREPILKGNASLHPEARHVLADGATVQLGETFDLVFAKDVIEHIEDDGRFLRNMNGHLRSDGLLMLVTHNSWSLNYVIQGSYHRLRSAEPWYGWDPTHVRWYDPRSLRRKLAASGFAAVRWFGSYHLPYRLISGRFGGRALEWRMFHVVEVAGLHRRRPLNQLGWSIGVVARKSETTAPR